LLETCALFDELKINYGSLEEKLNEREEYFSKREFELQELHRCEISKGKRKLLVLDFREILFEVANFNFSSIKRNQILIFVPSLPSLKPKDRWNNSTVKSARKSSLSSRS
jgi:hypothetical protein